MAFRAGKIELVVIKTGIGGKKSQKVFFSWGSLIRTGLSKLERHWFEALKRVIDGKKEIKNYRMD